MGLVSGETGRGTFVREPEWPTFLGTDTQTAAASMADLSFNYPSLPGRPSNCAPPCASWPSPATWTRCCATSRMAAGPMNAPSRAIWHGLRAPAERVLIVCGAQHGSPPPPCCGRATWWRWMR